MVRISLVLFSAILAFNLGARGDDKTPEQYWAETGLNFDFLAKKLQGTCYKDQKAYLACVQGLNVAASFLKPVATFATPQEVTQNPARFGAVIKNYGPYNLYKSVPQDPHLGFQANWEKAKVVRAAQMNAATETFNGPNGVNFKFGDILNELRGQLIQGDLAQSEGYIASEIFNTILASAVDPHTHIDAIAEIDDEMKSTDQSYVGIGASLDTVDGNTEIESPMPGSPALEAGLRSHDVISAVDGVSMLGQPPAAVVKKVKGPEGTSVKIGIIRKGNPIEVTIVRRKINIKNVDVRTVNDVNPSEPIGYIKLTNFMEDKACQTIGNALLSLESSGAKGVILDLRNNGGGLLNQAVCIGSLFVGKQVIVKVKDLKGGQFRDYPGLNNSITNLPLVTLINANSASASEILAGALQDYQRSWIAGDRSFGKASVQSPSKWTDKIEIFNTIQRFYEPSGRTNQIVGILPDFQIDPKPNATAEEKFALHEADYYTNALPSEGTPWVEPRPQDVAKIQACMNTSHLADTAYQKQLGGAIPPDYQLLSAEAILNCRH